jgi:CheY-like chemotaxis protein
MPQEKPLALVADDSPEILGYFSDFLRSKGFEVLEANDGDIAIEILERIREKIQLVLTDFKMNVANGDKVAKRAKEVGVKNIVIQSSAILKTIPPIDGVEIIKKDMSGDNNKLMEIISRITKPNE